MNNTDTLNIFDLAYYYIDIFGIGTFYINDVDSIICTHMLVDYNYNLKV